MGYSASRRNVLTCLVALEQTLRAQGFKCEAGAGFEAASARYRAAGADPASGAT